MPVPKHVALLVNPVHQQSLRTGNAVEKLLTQREVAHSTFTTAWPTNWDDFTEAWVVGGNGTLNHFINHYPQFHLPIGTIRAGTAGDFGWHLYGDLPVPQQVDRLLAAQPRPMDAGYCNNHLFLNGIGIGFDGKVVQDLLGAPRWNERLSYYRTVLKNILLFPPFLCTVNADGFHWGRKCLMINVANARRYGGGFLVAPSADLHDRLLDVNIIGAVSPLRRFRFLKAVEKGRHLHLHSVTYLKTGALHIKTAGIVPAHADGEYFDASEFVIECLPAKFSFLY